MTQRKLSPDKEIERKLRRVNSSFDKFVSNIQNKKKVISAASGAATRSLKNIVSNETKSQSELEKIKKESSTQIEKIKTDVGAYATSTKEDIVASANEIGEINKETKKAYGSFNTTYRAAMSGTKGIAVRQADIAARHEKVKETHNLISGISEAVQSQAAAVDDAHITSLENSSSIEDVKKRAEEVKEEIENTYGITVDVTLAGSIISRKKELEKLVGLWRSIMLGAFLMIMIIAIGLALVFSETNLADLVQQKLLYLTPLAVIIFIAYREYKNERRLLEEYSFKATSAQILRGYTVLLGGENYSDIDSKKKILEFLVTSMSGIFDRNSLDPKHAGNYHFTAGSKLARIEARIKQDILSEVMRKTPRLQKWRSSKLLRQLLSSRNVVDRLLTMGVSPVSYLCNKNS